MRLPTREQAIELDFQIDELAEILYKGVEVHALSESWAKAVDSPTFNPRNCVVWGDVPGHPNGYPLPLTVEAAAALKRLGYKRP